VPDSLQNCVQCFIITNLNCSFFLSLPLRVSDLFSLPLSCSTNTPLSSQDVNEGIQAVKQQHERQLQENSVALNVLWRTFVQAQASGNSPSSTNSS
jgi:hypothetical protein